VQGSVDKGVHEDDAVVPPRHGVTCAERQPVPFHAVNVSHFDGWTWPSRVTTVRLTAVTAIDAAATSTATAIAIRAGDMAVIRR
jgi:hypothetical protein